MSFGTKKVRSDALSEYLMLKKFWQNLGLTYSDFKELPYFMVDMLAEIMKIEEQYSANEIKKQYGKRS